MDEKSLLEAVGRGDHDAFAHLMQCHGAQALALAMRMTGCSADAEEIVQEAFLKLWKAAGRWDDRGNVKLGTWIYRVVMNLCLDRRRRAPMMELDGQAEPAIEPDALKRLGGREAHSLVAKALASLPERQRAAVALCYLGELSYREAAETLDISVTALESLLVRGRRGLRDFFVRRGLGKAGDVLL